MPRGTFDRSERRARTRAQLLAAAARVYARRGFAGATLDEVAEEAGFTKGAVYDHFGSKENLLFALLDEHLATQIAEQVALFDPAKAAAERPRAGSDQWMKELDEDPDSFRLFVEAWVHGQRDEELGRRVAAGIEQWRATLRAFGEARESDLETEISDVLLDQVANVMLGARHRARDGRAGRPRQRPAQTARGDAGAVAGIAGGKRGGAPTDRRRRWSRVL